MPDTTDAAIGADASTIEDDAPTPPPGPTNVVATANVTLGARLTWSAPADVTVSSYEIVGLPQGATARLAGTSAVVTGLAEGPITFSVTATSTEGTSPATASNEVTIVNGPAAPMNMIACGAASSATIRANDVTGATSYNIYYGDATVSMLSTTKETATTLPFRHLGLTNGQVSHYVVTAVNAAGVESVESMRDSAMPDVSVHDSVVASTYSSTNKIEIIDCLSKWPANTVATGRTIVGAATTLATSRYNNIAVDGPNARIYYRNQTSILVFNNATTVDGNVAPSRTITSAALTGGGGMALDPQRNLLYVANGGNSILVFTNIATANGAVTPARTISSAALTNAEGLTIDVANDRLYVANRVNVLVFNGASTANGTPTPARTITLAGETMTTYGTGLDIANNTLYVSLRNAQTISAVQASTANGDVTPSRVITGLNTPMGASVVGNRLFFLSDNGSNRIQFWANPGTVDGASTPTYVQFPTLTGASGFAYIP